MLITVREDYFKCKQINTRFDKTNEINAATSEFNIQDCSLCLNFSW